jgi:thioredoxin reductase
MTVATQDRDVYDITFIGAGPVALYGMYYAGLRLMKSKVIDMMGEVGGGLMALYPDKYIYDMAGFPAITARDLVNVMHEQAIQYPHTICLDEEVMSLERSDDGVFKLTSDKQTHWTKTVIICAGLGAYTPRKPNVPNLEKYEGSGVYYFIKNKNDFANRDILIVGGGNSAFDYAMMLEPIAKNITMIHRNSHFSAHEDTVRKVSNSKVKMKHPFWELKEIVGNGGVERAVIHETKSGESEELHVDAIVLNIGFITDLGPIAEWGLALDKELIVVDTHMRTNLEGVYAAGDIVTYDGKLKLISLGCGEVAIAVNNAKHLIDPKAKISPGHSTDKHIIALKKAAMKKEREEVEKNQ